MQSKNVRIIKPTQSLEALMAGDTEPKKKRVCAYCRVSTDTAEQKTSYEAQVDEYTKRILANPAWEMVRVYADEGISGTSTKNRKEFNSMIDAARNGELDLILTKSISRFTRNTVDCLNFIRELRTLGVEIFFEKENIYSSDTKVDFLLTIMSSIAQEEARNTSENVKWNIRKRFSEGIGAMNSKRFLGYRRDEKTKELIPDPVEAPIIREIFDLYVQGFGPAYIANVMQKKGYVTGAGKPFWRNSTINFILSNEKYCGDNIMQKTVTLDYLTHKRVINNGIAPKFVVENSHEPIISKETFLLAQQIRDSRKLSFQQTPDKNLAKFTTRYPYSGILICLECGRTLKRRYWNYGTSSARVMQQCGGYVEGKHNCKAKALYQESLENATIKMMNTVFWNNKKTLNTLERIHEEIRENNSCDKMLSQLEKEKTDLQVQLSALVDMRLSNSVLPDEIFSKKYKEINDGLREKMNAITTMQKQVFDTFSRESKFDQMKKALDNQKKPFDEISPELFRYFIYRMIAVSRNEVVFCIAIDKEYTDKEFADRRFEFAARKPIAEGSHFEAKFKNLLKYKVVII